MKHPITHPLKEFVLFASLSILSGLGILSHAAELPSGESVWRQTQLDANTHQWQYITLVTLHHNQAKVHLEFPFWAAYNSNVTLPQAVRNPQIVDNQLRFSGVFGKKNDPQTGQPTDDDFMLEFRLTIKSDVLMEGFALLDGNEFATMRLERIANTEMLLKECEYIAAALEIERAAAQAQLQPLRDAVDVWEKHIERQRREHRQVDHMTQMQHTLAIHAMRQTEIAYASAVNKIAAVQGIVVRLRASLKPSTETLSPLP